MVPQGKQWLFKPRKQAGGGVGGGGGGVVLKFWMHRW